MKCKNCQHSLSTDARFCEQCGQSVKSIERPIKPVLTEMLHEALDIDGRLFLTLKTLLSKPGLLSVEYRNGRRNRYTPPLRLYLFISIAFFLILPIIGPGDYFAAEPASSGADLYPKLMFALLPLFALLLQLFYRGTFYLSNLIFTIHLHCIAYLVLSITLPMEAWEGTFPILMVLQAPLAIYLLGYLLLAIKRYYQESWGKSTVKLLGLLVLYTAMMGISFDFLLPLTL